MSPALLTWHSQIGEIHGINKSLVAVGYDEKKVGSCKASHEEVQEKSHPGMFTLMPDQGKVNEFPLALSRNAVGRQNCLLLRPEPVLIFKLMPSRKR
ncbi:MAG TPA: hypothetical protein PKW97_02910 [Syntrophorhabdus sp.]|jgi:hypothetical protein|nr:MAG: hypothetical protein A4E59_02732 [Syntrophorhabdus sp. PtaB.Bin027]HQM25447.1 hypothetical protein [Syntrophorhabdus sp.]